jgi:hypothetical protein
MVIFEFKLILPLQNTTLDFSTFLVVVWGRNEGVGFCVES